MINQKLIDQLDKELGQNGGELVADTMLEYVKAIARKGNVLQQDAGTKKAVQISDNGMYMRILRPNGTGYNVFVSKAAQASIADSGADIEQAIKSYPIKSYQQTNQYGRKDNVLRIVSKAVTDTKSTRNWEAAEGYTTADAAQGAMAPVGSENDLNLGD